VIHRIGAARPSVSQKIREAAQSKCRDRENPQSQIPILGPAEKSKVKKVRQVRSASPRKSRRTSTVPIQTETGRNKSPRTQDEKNAANNCSRIDGFLESPVQKQCTQKPKAARLSQTQAGTQRKPSRKGNFPIRNQTEKKKGVHRDRGGEGGKKRHARLKCSWSNERPEKEKS